MKFYRIHPEVPGGIGKKTIYDKDKTPWELIRLHVIMEGWLGGDIMKISNCYLVTKQLKEDLEQFELTGIAGFEEIEIDYSNTFKKLYPNRTLPKIYRISVSGIAGYDDFGMIDYYKIAVSEKALAIIKNWDVSDMEVYDFEGKISDHPI